jgi:hypothetical protein
LFESVKPLSDDLKRDLAHAPRLKPTLDLADGISFNVAAFIVGARLGEQSVKKRVRWAGGLFADAVIAQHKFKAIHS